MEFLAWLFWALPIFPVWWTWAGVFDEQHTEQLRRIALTPLLMLTAAAGVSALGSAWLAFRPPPQTTSGPPAEFAIVGWVLLLLLLALVLGLILKRRSPSWLFRRVMLIAGTWFFVAFLLAGISD